MVYDPVGKHLQTYFDLVGPAGLPTYMYMW